MEHVSFSSVSGGSQNDHQQFQRFLDRLPVGAYICDQNGLITYFNDHAVKIWGRSPALHDPADRYCGSHRLFAPDGSPVPHEDCWSAQALQTGREFDGVEMVLERRDGTRATVLAQASPLRNAAGAISGAINVLIDITERKRAVDDLRSAEEALRNADRRKDEFLAMLAHELRNPLAPLSNSLQILRLTDELSPAVESIRDVMQRQVDHLVRLVDDLLEVSRITCGKVDLRKENVELAAIVANAVETSRPLIEAAGHQLAVTICPEPLTLEADPLRLGQVISNLLNNAAKYTEDGGQIWLVARHENDQAVISVRDTGIGISADMLPKIFVMFAQVNDTIRRSQGGLGIGLTLAKKLVEMHGGQISARSDGPGKGSEFEIRLPLAAPIARLALARSEPLPAMTSISAHRILVVDDTPTAAMLLAKLLEKLGQEVRTAHSAAEALETIQHFVPNVVISDLGMPLVDGYELARRMREDSRTREAILIALSGYGQDSDRQRSKEAGFDRHLIKPASMDALRELLNSLPATALR